MQGVMLPLALALVLASVPAHADREIFTFDCQGQLHWMAGTPVALSGGMVDLDDLLNHAVKMLKDRLACSGVCNAPMSEDEFLRKYHPIPALLNLMKNEPKVDQKCTTTKYSALHTEIVKLFKNDLIPNVVTGQPDGWLPCSYTDLSPDGPGCAFKIESKTPDILPLDLAVALKMCPNSNVPSISVVAKGSFADNLLKPCDASATCTAGLSCKDTIDLLSSSDRRSGQPKFIDTLFSGDTFLKSKPSMPSQAAQYVSALVEKIGLGDYLKKFDSSNKLNTFRTRLAKMQSSLGSLTHALKSVKDTIADGMVATAPLLKHNMQHSSRSLLATKRSLLATPSDQNNDAYGVFETVGLYDTNDGKPGCLTFGSMVANMRRFSQIFFRDAIVASDSSYNFCVPDMKITDLEAFARDTWGIEDKENKLHLPIKKWDGIMTRGMNVFDANRLDGSVFVGSATALKPPAPDAAASVMPVMGLTCEGQGYLQFGTKMGGSGMAPGIKSMFDFLTEQGMEMQQCRAAKRTAKYVFSRPDFMRFFALYTPLAWLSVFTTPPDDKMFDIFKEKMVNTWNKLEVTMSSLVGVLVAGDDMMNLDQLDFKVNFKNIASCAAKDYGTKGCTMSMNLRSILGTADESAAVMGMKQCFSTSLSVPFPAGGMALKGSLGMTLAPLKTCEETSDCPGGFMCETNGIGEIKQLPDFFDCLISGCDEECTQTSTNSTSACSTGSGASQCKSTKGTSNKFMAELIKYFTGSTTQSDTVFGFCVPKLSLPDDFGSVVTTKEEEGQTEIIVPALSGYTGALPGITDQPAVIFAFPPPDSASYTFPQESKRRVQWVSFNLPSGTVSLTLFQATTAVSEVTYKDLDNTMNQLVTLPTTVAVGPGYHMQLCHSTGQCWKSGGFTVKPKIIDQKPPVEHDQIMPGDPTVLIVGSEARGVFVAGMKTSTAVTLGIATHRVEVYDIKGLTTTRRTTGIQVRMRIHADDTEQDATTNDVLLVQLQDPENQQALVATSGDFMTAAQTSNANITSLTNDEYSDVESFKEMKAACDSGNCKEFSLGSEDEVTLPIVAIVVGVGAGVLCCLGVCAGAYFMAKRSGKHKINPTEP